MIAESDREGSGTISFNTFQAVMAGKMHARDPKEESIKAFRLFDDDETGASSAPRCHVPTPHGCATPVALPRPARLALTSARACDACAQTAEARLTMHETAECGGRLADGAVGSQPGEWLRGIRASAA